MKTGGNQARAGRGEAINTVSEWSGLEIMETGKENFFPWYLGFHHRNESEGALDQVWRFSFLISIQASHANTQSNGNEIMKSVQSRTKED